MSRFMNHSISALAAIFIAVTSIATIVSVPDAPVHPVAAPTLATELA
ncbi:MAG: hypothetical protein WA985_05430 [Erythrobacter sp.]